MAALALVGIATTLLIAEPEKRVAAGTAEREGKIAQFADRYAGLPPALRETLVWIYGAITPMAMSLRRNRPMKASSTSASQPKRAKKSTNGQTMAP